MGLRNMSTQFITKPRSVKMIFCDLVLVHFQNLLISQGMIDAQHFGKIP